MSAKAPTSGEWWRLVELNTDIPTARYLTLQSHDYKVTPFRRDWEEHYKQRWRADANDMVINDIGDSYGPWHEGARPL